MEWNTADGKTLLAKAKLVLRLRRALRAADWAAVEEVTVQATVEGVDEPEVRAFFLYICPE